MSLATPELLIISGGSEISGLAVAEAAHAAAIPYAVFSLSPDSMLQDVPGCVACTDLSSMIGDWRTLRDEFLLALAGLQRSGSSRLAILPTEDGGLRLLNECRDEVMEYGEFPRARALRMGGVDKAEVVERIERQGLSDGMATSKVLVDPSSAISAMGEFGVNAIFKPALKPLDMDLSGMGGRGVKVVTQRDERESADSVLKRLRDAWPLSQRWIAQPRLLVGAGLERSVCAVRGDVIHACQVVERAKYPCMGGTAYWVSTDLRRDLVPSAASLLETLDVVGMCELSYLPDTSGNSHMIEFNPRPWLQLGLIERAGFPIVVESIAALRDMGSILASAHAAHCDWLQPERMLLALLARQCSLREFGRMSKLLFHQTTTVAGYGSAFPNARARLAVRALRKVFMRR